MDVQPDTGLYIMLKAHDEREKEHVKSETEIERGEGGGEEIGLISSEEGDQCGKSGRRGVGFA